MKHSRGRGGARRRGGRRAPRRAPVGAAPGTLVSDPDASDTRVDLVVYGGGREPVRREVGVEDLAAELGTDRKLWIRVRGLGDAVLIERLGRLLGLHGLLVEDLVNARQRAKVEEYGDTLFVIVRRLLPEEQGATEQVSLVLRPGVVLSFQESSADVFDPVLQRLGRVGGRMSEAGSDYLLYALLDTVVDDWFPRLESFGERLEILEEETLGSSRESTLQALHAIRREAVHMRRALWPTREMIGTLLRGDVESIRPETRVYLRDTHDHVVQLLEILESERELVASLMEAWLSRVSQRMNEIMQVLTIIATIFIPLTFVVGVYGMNFDTKASPWNMPELGWRYGYPLCILIMLILALGMLAFFRRKGWLGSLVSRDARPRGEEPPGPEAPHV